MCSLCVRYNKREVSIYFHTFIACDSHDLLYTTTLRCVSIRKSLKRVYLRSFRRVYTHVPTRRGLFILFLLIKKCTVGQVFFPDLSSSIDVLIKRVTGTAETSTNISLFSILVTHNRRVLLEKN